MKKHGISHALSVLVCTIASALLIDVIRDYIPVVNRALYYVCKGIIDLLGLHVSPQGLSLLILASFLAMIWGMAFAKMHYR